MDVLCKQAAQWLCSLQDDKPWSSYGVQSHVVKNVSHQLSLQVPCGQECKPPVVSPVVEMHPVKALSAWSHSPSSCVRGRVLTQWSGRAGSRGLSQCPGPPFCPADTSSPHGSQAAADSATNPRPPQTPSPASSCRQKYMHPAAEIQGKKGVVPTHAASPCHNAFLKC